MENNLLEEGLDILCQNDLDTQTPILPRREKIILLLQKYIDQIELYNPAWGLVGTNDRRELVIRHILDSLAPLGLMCRLLKACGAITHIADVGSGAGLPGIPLAIALPNVRFTLIERSGRRANFLRNALGDLALPNVSVEEAEMEKIKMLGYFDLVTFRAFKPLEPKLLKCLLRLCTAGGALVAYKGRREKVESEMAALENSLIVKGQKYPAIRWELLPCPTPLLDEERHILLIRGEGSSCL